MLKLKIPWWGKIIAKLLLSRLPFGYAFWQRLGLFRHGMMDSSEYAIQVFNNHTEKLDRHGFLRGKLILELGPGDSIATAIIAAAHGATAILVDAGAFVRSDITPYLQLTKILTKRGLAPVDLSDCQTVDDILTQCGAQYLTSGLMSMAQIESNSIDLIFSQAVLEHVRKNEFIETMRECSRILKTHGVCSHQIDLRDHLDGALNNLRFSERVWESDLMANSGFYTNRIRFGQMIDIFEQTGFIVNVTESSTWNSLPTPINRLDEEFMEIPLSELVIFRFDVVLRKKA